MARAPFQVVVLPFRRDQRGDVEYAIFRRSDDGLWQGIAGGGEDRETALEAARREAWEEARIPAASALYPLSILDHVPVSSFPKARLNWPDDLYVIPQHFFACDANGLTLSLSNEHTEFRWLPLDGADALLRYDSSRNALWELAERLARDDLGPAPIAR
jgi:dATP pyrophosphohydrolase